MAVLGLLLLDFIATLLQKYLKVSIINKYNYVGLGQVEEESL